MAKQQQRKHKYDADQLLWSSKRTRSWLKFNKLGEKLINTFSLVYPIFNINKTRISPFTPSNPLFASQPHPLRLNAARELNLNDKFQAMSFIVKHSPELCTVKKDIITTQTRTPWCIYTTHNTQSDNSLRYEDIVFQLHVTFLFALSAPPPPPSRTLSFPFALACWKWFYELTAIAFFYCCW